MKKPFSTHICLTEKSHHYFLLDTRCWL